MMRFRGLTLFLFLCAAISLSGQYSKEFKRIFLDADYLYETGFYEEAYNRYKNLLRLDPGNSNVLFRCGTCCLYIPGREKESIDYLSEAVKNVDPSYDIRSQTETSAPVLAYFMMGLAYHLDNQFDLAIEFYQKYVEGGRDEDPLQVEYANMQIEACERGKEMIDINYDILFTSVLDKFDEEMPSCSNPVVSGDGNILIFLVDYPADKKIMMTTKDGNTWTHPHNINSEIGMVGETEPVCLSYDGKELYLMHRYYSHSDLFVSRYENGRWTEAEPLNRNINKKTSENHASISSDGNRLYFTSDRRGGYGSFDIYVSEKDEDGEWGPAENIGPAINTPYEEHSPFITADDSILFFSSQGHATMGGIDVFFSEKSADGSWQRPLNVGYPVSTSDDDVFFNPGWDNFEGYYAVRKASDPSSNTINMVIQFESEEQLEEYVAEYPEELYLERADGGEGHEAVTVALLAEASSDSEAGQQRIDTVYIYPSGKEVQVESQEEDPPATTVQVPGTTTVVPVYTHRVDTVYLYETGQQVQKEVQGDTRETTTTQTTEAAAVATVVTPSMASDSRTESSSTRQESATTRENRRSVESQQATEAYTARISPAEHVSPSVASNVSARPAKVVTGIPFDFDEEKLNLAAMLEVEKLLDLMNNFPDITIDLEGHTDDIGPSEYNKQLSYRRAKMVSDYLTDRGIDSKRISVSGKGETQPHAINIQADGSDSPIGRFLNRQVTATISGLNSSMNELNMFYVPLSLRPGSNMRSTVAASNGYTIQVLALRKPVRKGYFINLEGVKEHMSGDGLYRYTYGKYASYKEAKQHLSKLKAAGYSDAFVQPCARYSR